ncbi:hypothetical protein BDA99DRAFT_541647 [Phascolomyces articulosus]|uniref:Uncharacterized protein n=1 Tax=Phascolomyces articulosus TaxID=60185 RepID=A0AAD5K1N7_9FUNG|nr:hypothetical protein BDA99DRAFT_541647 [Phascolomyces articulosus]
MSRYALYKFKKKNNLRETAIKYQILSSYNHAYFCLVELEGLTATHSHHPFLLAVIWISSQFFFGIFFLTKICLPLTNLSKTNHKEPIIVFSHTTSPNPILHEIVIQ